MAGEGARTHTDIGAGWAAIPEGQTPKVIPYFGRGHHTLNRAGLVEGRVKVTKEDPEWRGNVGWRGDGTVPAISAIPAELNEREELWRAVPDKHVPMGCTPAVMDLLTSLLGDELPKRGGLVPDRPWVGFDLDDVVLSGREIPLGAELLGGRDGPGSSATVTVTSIDPTSGPEWPPEQMVTRDGQWVTRLPPLPPGLYEVSVEVKDGWYGTPVYGSVPLAVIEPDEDLVPDSEVAP